MQIISSGLLVGENLDTRYIKQCKCHIKCLPVLIVWLKMRNMMKSEDTLPLALQCILLYWFCSSFVPIYSFVPVSSSKNQYSRTGVSNALQDMGQNNPALVQNGQGIFSDMLVTGSFFPFYTLSRQLGAVPTPLLLLPALPLPGCCWAQLPIGEELYGHLQTASILLPLLPDPAPPSASCGTGTARNHN